MFKQDKFIYARCDKNIQSCLKVQNLKIFNFRTPQVLEFCRVLKYLFKNNEKYEYI